MTESHEFQKLFETHATCNILKQKEKAFSLPLFRTQATLRHISEN